MTDLQTPTVFSVEGNIHNKFNYPIPNANVQLFDKDLRSEQLLGRANTDVYGFYKIQFNGSSYAAREVNTPDLFIRVLEHTGSILGQSDILFNVGQNTIINFTVGNGPFKELNEFEILFRKVNPLVVDSNLILGQLVENGINQDITFLAGELSENSKKIRLLNNSFFNQLKTGIPAAVYYGLFRTGISSEENNILILIDAKLITSHLKRAVDQNIISAQILEELGSIINLFKRLNQ
jgi:hypothetical protein